LLCLEDIDGLSEEAEFAFRELQSNGELNSATSIKLENGTITSGHKTVKFLLPRLPVLIEEILPGLRS